MLKFDRLLVPVDFSRDSMAAMGYAMALAKKLQGSQTVIAFHVVDEGLPVTVEGKSDQGRREQEKALKVDAEARLSRWMARFEPGEEVLETKVRIGRPASEVICEYAGATGVDMIILGTQGKGAIRRLVLGSTVQQVQRLSSVPVLSVKDPAAKMDQE